MGQLEDALRETFTAKVAAVPAVEEAADRAMRGADRVRRRRILATAATAFVAVVAIGVSVATGHPAAPVPPIHVAEPTASPTDAAVDVAVLNGDTIVPADGSRVELTGLPAVRQLWQVATGWLVETDGATPATTAIWSVLRTGTAHKVVEAPRIAVGFTTTSVTVTPTANDTATAVWPAGPVIAWLSSGHLVAAAVVEGRLTPPASTADVGNLLPVGIVDDGVLLVTADGARHDMWFPAKGTFRPGPTGHGPILAVAGDGRGLFGLTPAGCLASLSPHAFAVTASTCGVRPARQDHVWSSHDGHWLVIGSATALTVYDLTHLWSTPTATAHWSIAATAVTWLDDGSLVVATGDGFYHLRPADPAARERLHPTLEPSPVRLVATRLNP
jgi:hypothetical protein